jgi:hypothetical protein
MVERMSGEEYGNRVSENFIEFAVRFMVENERVHDVVFCDYSSKYHNFFRPYLESFEKSEIGKGVFIGMIHHISSFVRDHVDKVEFGDHKIRIKFLDRQGGEYE